MTRLAGKVAVITGAAGGIGAEIARHMAEEGAIIACADLVLEHAAAVAASIDPDGKTAAGFAMDVADRESVHGAIAAIARDFGRIDIVVNSAMWLRYQPLAEVKPHHIDKMMSIAVGGVIWTAQAAAPYLAKTGGAIVNMSSVASVRASPNAAVYCAAKGAVSALTRQLAADLGPQGIRVNAIAPGFVETDAARKNLGEERIAWRKQTTPLGRLAAPSDVASLAVYLSSEESRFLTGEVIILDGGRTSCSLSD